MPGEDWLKSMQTLVSKLLELDQNGTACKEFTDHFLDSEYSERLSSDSEFMDILAPCIDFWNPYVNYLEDSKVKI